MSKVIVVVFLFSASGKIRFKMLINIFGFLSCDNLGRTKKLLIFNLNTFVNFDFFVLKERFC